MDRLCSSVHLLSACSGREADVLKEIVGFLTEESEIFLGLLAQCFAFFLFVLLLNFLGSDTCSNSTLKMTGFVHPC